MANKTFIPAFKAKVGDWEYYICIMKYAEVARQVSFAYELGGNSELNTMVQRGLSARTQSIKEYLLSSEHRFLGALIVAAWGGAPTYSSVSMEDPDGMLSGIDRQFGVLSFDGTQQYFALDGQHRLKAIKEAIKTKPEIGSEDICVILVSHYDSEDGKIRTRRLFTNINRNAKATTGAENVVLDEDDGAAIITRRLLTDHEFFSKDGIIKVFTAQGEDGELRLAAGNVSKTEKKAFSTIITLYEVVKILCFDLDISMQKSGARPSDDILEKSYGIIADRLISLVGAAGPIEAHLHGGGSARDLRAPKDQESEGNAFMRPVVQKAVARIASEITKQGVIPWETVVSRLSSLSWKIKDGPWSAVFNAENNKMITAKDNVQVLDQLIYSHIAPPSKASIAKARKEYKIIRGQNYQYSEDELISNLAPHTQVLPSVGDISESDN